ncbi:unnamed protein product [Hermetia illucens]|uniref:Uncharacterized protein n=1 Tax=Hermetia illucens TaxID=343691 RepID=A0A7R8YY05_HERIL|nr:unnamed protein product [Hermetia illucens]
MFLEFCSFGQEAQFLQVRLNVASDRFHGLKRCILPHLLENTKHTSQMLFMILWCVQKNQDVVDEFENDVDLPQACVNGAASESFKLQNAR